MRLPTRPTTILALLISVAGALTGDLAMLGIVAFARLISPVLFIQWFVAFVLITVLSYVFFGLTQLKAWEKDRIKPAAGNDIRTRWSLRLIGDGRRTSFVVASLLGGPLAVGYAAGYTHDPHGHRKTFISALILAAFWSAIYLGVVNIIIATFK